MIPSGRRRQKTCDRRHFAHRPYVGGTSTFDVKHGRQMHVLAKTFALRPNLTSHDDVLPTFIYVCLLLVFLVLCPKTGSWHSVAYTTHFMHTTYLRLYTIHLIAQHISVHTSYLSAHTTSQCAVHTTYIIL